MCGLVAAVLSCAACSAAPGSDTEETGLASEAVRETTSAAPTEIGKSGLYLEATIPLPSLRPGAKFSYDIGAVDAHAHRYFLADRTNRSLDILDLRTFAWRQVPGFAGAHASNDVSGPNGVVVVPHGLVYVGDVDAVRVVDPEAGLIVKTIPITTTGLRTDEGCYDPDDRIVMFQNPADSPPFVTFLSAETSEVVARLELAGSAGLEACVYDPRTRSFLLNNDGTAANPDGEVDRIPARSVVARRPEVSRAYPLGTCGPTGIALGRRDDVVIGCDAPAGDVQRTLVLDADDGSIRRAVTRVGGDDEAAFDPRLDRFYVAARNMTASGISQTGIAGATLTPVLGILDARTGRWIDNIPIGAGVHSVATDPETGRVIVPLPPTATAPGGVQIYAPVCDDDDHGRDDASRRCGCERSPRAPE